MVVGEHLLGVGVSGVKLDIFGVDRVDERFDHWARILCSDRLELLEEIVEEERGEAFTLR